MNHAINEKKEKTTNNSRKKIKKYISPLVLSHAYANTDYVIIFF